MWGMTGKPWPTKKPKPKPYGYLRDEKLNALRRELAWASTKECPFKHGPGLVWDPSVGEHRNYHLAQAVRLAKSLSR